MLNLFYSVFFESCTELTVVIYLPCIYFFSLYVASLKTNICFWIFPILNVISSLKKKHQKTDKTCFFFLHVFFIVYKYTQRDINAFGKWNYLNPSPFFWWKSSLFHLTSWSHFRWIKTSIVTAMQNCMFISLKAEGEGFY